MRSITPDDVRFADATAPPRGDVHCPVCGNHGDARPVLDVPGLAEPYPALTLLRCGVCASLFYDPPGIRDFSDLDQKRDDFWRFYVEAGGGVWETIWPILRGRDLGRLLDIGCGFGFALDFWQRTGRGEAIGVELADYGRIGAEQLGVTIHDQLLQDCAALAGQRFDVVYASEVIEHVPDARAFAALIAHWVADDGMLILTTPAAAFIVPENRSTTMLAALAPGFHGFLLSEQAFVEAVRAAGFPHVEARVYNERQMVWASRRPFTLAPEAGLRSPYFEYMAQRFALPDDATPLWQGYAYRYLRDLVNTGRLADATPVADRLAAAIAGAYGEAALDPARAVPRLAACTTLTEAGRVGPYFLPCFYQFAGAVAQHVRGDPVAARRWYAGAAAASEACTRLGGLFYLEATAILWAARIADALITLAQGDAAGAHVLARVADEGLTCTAANSFATVAPAQIESLLPPVAEELAARGQWDPARTIAAAYERYVARRYGPALTTLDGIARALDDANADRPDDALFPALFAGLNAMQDPARRDEGRAALAALAEVADRVGGAYAARARAIAAKARKAAGLPAREPAFSFEMSFNLSPPSR